MVGDDDFWERCAKADPLWAILSDPTKRGRRWDIAGFFETGRREVSLLLYQLKQLGAIPNPGRALDFGCGVGRLTQALAEHFKEVVGVDISPTMLRLAGRLNQHGCRVSYVENAEPHLAGLASSSFDFVYSDIVLQHIPPPITVNYVKEFLRLLRPGGLLVFQLPSHRREVESAGPIAMPDHVYRVALEVLTPLSTLPAASEATLLVHATNISDRSWSRADSGVFRIGNHWLDGATGAMLVQDDARVALPDCVEPHQTHAVSLRVQAPPDPGNYLCEIDAVHEGISWFGDKGGKTLRFPVRVVDSSVHSVLDTPTTVPVLNAPPSAGQPPSWPDIYEGLPSLSEGPTQFPMFGVPRTTVARLVEESGGRLFHIEQDERGGQEWVGFKYFVVKPR